MSTSSPTKTSAPTATAVPSGLTSYSGGCSEAAPGAPPTSLPANPREARLELRIPSMDCPNEERQIRAALERIAGVRAMKFDLGQRRLTVDAPEATWPHVIAAINQLGFETYPPTGPSAGAVAQVDACATTDSCCSSACAAPVALATDAAQENAAEFQGLLLRVPAMGLPDGRGSDSSRSGRVGRGATTAVRPSRAHVVGRCAGISQGSCDASAAGQRLQVGGAKRTTIG